LRHGGAGQVGLDLLVWGPAGAVTQTLERQKSTRLHMGSAAQSFGPFAIPNSIPSFQTQEKVVLPRLLSKFVFFLSEP
jgi:hypothetical protein